MAVKSKQPRFTDKRFSSVFEWWRAVSCDEPEYQPDSRKRDAWLSEIWRLETHLAGVLSSVVSIDANRGWSLIGGRNQVMRYSKVLHNWQSAPGRTGYRNGATAAALAYYSTDLGSVIELGRDGRAGPVRAFFHVDSTRCKLTGNSDAPLKYYPSSGKVQDWAYGDYMQMVSMNQIQEKYNGLGFCAVSRCIELTKIMIAVYEHDKEELGAQAPRGLLLLHGVSEAQWMQAMKARKEMLAGEGFRYFDAVAVLASEGMEDIDAKLIALSNLPQGFDLNVFVQLLMYGYALCFGYDPSEFYPVQFGSLGRGTEMEVQHQKATGKGGLNFILALHEQLTRDDVLPDTLALEYDQRDDAGELLAAGVQQTWADLYKTLREAGLPLDGQGLISRDEARVMLAEHDIIPRDWTEASDEAEATDIKDAEDQEEPVEPTPPAEPTPVAQQRKRDELLANPAVMRCVQAFPDEPVIRYTWPANRTVMLWESGGDLLRRKLYVAAKRRQVDEIYWKDADVEITSADANQAVADGIRRMGPTWGSILDNEPLP